MQGFSGQINLNSMWFFEKPASRMNDPTPMYQGTVVDHQIKIKPGFGGTHTTANWEPVIQEMGNKGWELACILETPETQFSGMTTILMNCKLFFQRPLLLQMGAAAPAPVPPSYDAVVGGQGALPPAGFQVSPAPEKMGY